jgi:hypothetical protein
LYHSKLTFSTLNAHYRRLKFLGYVEASDLCNNPSSWQQFGKLFTNRQSTVRRRPILLGPEFVSDIENIRLWNKTFTKHLQVTAICHLCTKDIKSNQMSQINCSQNHDMRMTISDFLNENIRGFFYSKIQYFLNGFGDKLHIHHWMSHCGVKAISRMSDAHANANDNNLFFSGSYFHQIAHSQYFVTSIFFTVRRRNPTLLSAVRNCLFSTFAATLHVWRPSPPSATRGCVIMSWKGGHQHTLSFLGSRSKRREN